MGEGGIGATERSGVLQMPNVDMYFSFHVFKA